MFWGRRSRPEITVELDLGGRHHRHHHHHHHHSYQPPVQTTYVHWNTHWNNMAFYGWMPPSHCQGTVNWIHSSEGCVPPNAVHAGVDKDGSPIFAGRAFHEGDLLPAKVTPSHGCAYVSWGGQEIKKHQYEVLCSSHVAWQFGAGGQVPAEAICCGHTSNGERLYMGRHMIDGTMTVGKIHPSHGCVYIPYDGREISYAEYECLVLT